MENSLNCQYIPLDKSKAIESYIRSIPECNTEEECKNAFESDLKNFFDQKDKNEYRKGGKIPFKWG